MINSAERVAFDSALGGERTEPDQPRAVVTEPRAGARHYFRIAVTRTSASEHFQSPFLSGDVIVLSGSAWSTVTGERISVPEDGLVDEIANLIGHKLYSRLLPSLRVDASFGIATWHLFVLVDEDGEPYHPSPFQVSAVNRYNDAVGRALRDRESAHPQ